MVFRSAITPILANKGLVGLSYPKREKFFALAASPITKIITVFSLSAVKVAGGNNICSEENFRFMLWYFHVLPIYDHGMILEPNREEYLSIQSDLLAFK